MQVVDLISEGLNDVHSQVVCGSDREVASLEENQRPGKLPALPCNFDEMLER